MNVSTAALKRRSKKTEAAEAGTAGSKDQVGTWRKQPSHCAGCLHRRVRMLLGMPVITYVVGKED